MKRLLTYLLALTAAAALHGASRVAPGIENYVDYYARPEALNEPQYTADGKAILRLVDSKRVVRTDINTGSDTETVFDVATARTTTIADVEGFMASPDGSKLLLWRSKKSIYRHSFTAEYYVYELRSRILTPLSTAHSPQRAPLFSPDGRMVAFVADDNNIYLRKLDYDTEVAVTTDGRPGDIINGVPGWAYEEEFATIQSMAWSPDNLMLCYIKYDETDVPLYSLALYDTPCDPRPQYALYPGALSYKYPVAGEPNSKVTIMSYDVETRKNLTLPLPADIEYIPSILFSPDPASLIAVTLNRAQTRMELYSINPRSTVARSILVDQSNVWLEPLAYESLTALPGGIVLFSARSGYSHLYLYSYTGQLLRQLTSGNYDVTAYYGFDPASGRHFYQSTATGPVNRVVCSVDAKGTVKQLSEPKGTASAWLSPDGAWYTIRYSSVTVPDRYTLYATRGDKKTRVLEDNATYAAAHPMDADKQFFTFTTTDGVELNGFIVKDPKLDLNRRHPVIMYQYSGPGSQEVRDRWDRGWMNYYALQGFVIVCVDGRGTGGRGRAFMDVVYKDLGHYETIDQCAAARYAASLPYVDPARIGIFGWSYGGYETLMALTTGTFDYACGVAVAPVTDWRLYDTVYTERYMLTPRENPDGYRRSAPLNHVENLRCPLLIMYGTADDNVHPANTIEYMAALESAGSWADMLLFPDMNHSIYGCNSRQVLYSRMLDYFKTHLDGRK